MASRVHPSPTILLPDLPLKTLVGIDLITFTSTSNFHGIKDLPSGWHFLYSGTTESLSLRSGAWFYIGDISAAGTEQSDSALIYIWKWSAETESLATLRGDSDADRQEAMRYKANLSSIWQRGGLFRYRSRVSAPWRANQRGSEQAGVAEAEEDSEAEEQGRKDWRQLTSRISPQMLSRVVGDPNYDVDGHPRWMVTSASSASRDADHIPGLDTPTVGPDGVPGAMGQQERDFGFLPIDLKRTWREGAIGRERTDAAQDRSWALGDLISRYSSRILGETAIDEREGESQVLGEIQFTFIMVMTMMNYSCLQQWKRLVELVLTSRQAILDREHFISAFLRLLLQQLKRCDDVEGGVFEIDGDDGGAFLRELLVKFRRSVDFMLEDGARSTVKVELAKIERWVKEEFDWDLKPADFVKRGMLQLEDGEQVEMDVSDNDEDEETGEYAPVIVEEGGGTL
ncbi:hypothetical protein N7470_001606 [Penicillium chermesinum]|nr:hypothetical protein N7470_001606 [Penicillium chermesinum]